MKNLPEEIHARFETRFLRPLFGVSFDDLFPCTGDVFNEIRSWPTFLNAKKVLPTSR